MNCNDLTDDLILDFIESSCTDGSVLENIKKHLNECNTCRKRFDEISKIFRDLKVCYTKSDVSVPEWVDEVINTEVERFNKKDLKPEHTKVAVKTRLIGVFVVSGAFIFLLFFVLPNFLNQMKQLPEDTNVKLTKNNQFSDNFADEKLKTLEEELENQKKQVSEKDKIIEELNRKLTKIDSELQIKKEEIKTLKVKLDDSNKTISTLSERLTEVSVQLKELKDYNVLLGEKLSPKGDINSDGVVNILDSFLLCNYILGNITTEQVGHKNILRCDMNNDNKIDVADSLRILKLTLEEYR